jgi:polysaccharide export outer membrane protein
MPVRSGDLINVPEAGMFFVDGAVQRPGSYPLGRRYSLTQALAIAGGVNRDLYSADLTIFRRKGNSEVEPISVDLNAVVARTVVDPQIEPDDVILVPIHGFKYAYHRVIGQILGWSHSVIGVAAR